MSILSVEWTQSQQSAIRVYRTSKDDRLRFMIIIIKMLWWNYLFIAFTICYQPGIAACLITRQKKIPASSLLCKKRFLCNFAACQAPAGQLTKAKLMVAPNQNVMALGVDSQLCFKLSSSLRIPRNRWSWHLLTCSYTCALSILQDKLGQTYCVRSGDLLLWAHIYMRGIYIPLKLTT